ncbi:MAG: 4-(cytidine 5'-diphospho)-2-C-methyl-D-erythritol kinase [Alphaproteobacteria bacterium]
MSKHPTLTEAAPAKLNLFLHVLGKLDNGYHDLESLVVFLDLYDWVQLVPSEAFALSIDGDLAKQLETEGAAPKNNLVMKAAQGLAKIASKPLDFGLKLTKNIPVQAGLGGGSADAAACLRLLCRYWGLDWQDTEVQNLALQLGADVPVCLRSKPCLMRGIGEHLTAFDVPALNLLVTNPMKAVSTKSIFTKLNLTPGTKLREPLSAQDLVGDPLELIKNTMNDLQATACTLEPAIERSLRLLGQNPNAGVSRMTGSGATCFAMFGSTDAAARHTTYLKQHPDQWFWSGSTLT